MGNPTCLVCDSAIPARDGRGPKRKYCSAQCRNNYAPRCAVSFPECEFCGNRFTARRSKGARACMSAECRRLIKNEQQRSYFAAYQQEHGKTYVHSRYADKRIEYKLKRRGLLTEGSESFLSAEVFERDGWICQLCYEPVDATLPWPHRMSKTLDHVLPVAKGGAHTRANTQLTHLTCNASKRDSLDWEVMADGRTRDEAEACRAEPQPQ